MAFCHPELVEGSVRSAFSLFTLVPKLYLGTPLSAQLCCSVGLREGSAMELPQQVRSQIEFGNKGRRGGEELGERSSVQCTLVASGLMFI